MGSAEILRDDMQWWISQKLKSGNPASSREALDFIEEKGNSTTVHQATSVIDRNLEERVAAIRSLANRHDSSVLPALLAALKDREPAVRERSILSLKNFDSNETTPHLIPLLKDPDASVRAAVAHSLETVRWKPADEQEQAQLLVALGDYRQAATLGESAFAPLIDALRDHGHFTRRLALEALAQSDDDRVGKVLVDCLSDPDTQIRVAAAEKLANFQGDEYVVALSQALSDPEPMLRAAAASSLSRMGNATCVPFLMETLKDDQRSVRKASADALGQMGCPEALGELANALKDSDPGVREATLIAMGHIGDRRAVEYAVEALADTASCVRSAAAAALNALDPDWQLSGAAQQTGSNPEPSSQAEASSVRSGTTALWVRSDGGQGPVAADSGPRPTKSAPRRAQVLQTLLQALEDFDRDIRLAATEALGRLQDESCAEPLRVRLKDTDEWVQLAADMALRQLTRHEPANRTPGLRVSTA